MFWNQYQPPEFYSAMARGLARNAARTPSKATRGELLLKIGLSSVPLVTLVTVLTILVFGNIG